MNYLQTHSKSNQFEKLEAAKAASLVCLREAFIKKNILLLTFVNKDFTPPPLIIDKKPLRFGGPLYKSEK